MIIGLGIDVVPIERFESASARTSSLIERVFTENERFTLSGSARSSESLAARFAAKEALAKALGSGGDMAWHDAEVVVNDVGNPSLVMRGTVAARAASLGVKTCHVSLSHDGGIASAVVIAES